MYKLYVSGDVIALNYHRVVMLIYIVIVLFTEFFPTGYVRVLPRSFPATREPRVCAEEWA